MPATAQNFEKEKYFDERTNKHIERVQDNVRRIVNNFPEYAEALKNVEKHDASKLEEPERTPYVEITWKHRLDRFNGYKTPGTLPDPKENEATVHHITNNAHHPEYWLDDKREANVDPKDRNKSKKCVDASKMPDIQLVEMVADWEAMSQELKKNTAREWYDSKKDTRWHFSPHQDEIINKLLKVFEYGK